jgi:hypothetical protein
MRNLALFETFTTSQISTIEEDDIPQVVDVLHSSFGHIDDKETIATKLRPRMLNDLSLKLSIDGQIVGCYLLAEKSVNVFIEGIQTGALKDFPSETTQIYLQDHLSDKGLQGIALSLLPEWRSQGYGNLLKNWYFNDHRFDYVWGVQDKRLGNIEDWKKSRDVIAESPTHFATLRRL